MKRLLVLCVVLAGCSLYTGDDDDDVCNGAAENIPAQGTRDPQTGTCTFETPCDPACGEACPGTAGIAIAGGECDGPCESLDEQTCLGTSTCHAAYLENASGSAAFWGCWDITPLAPQDSASCSGLDASSCFIDPACTSMYTTGPSGATDFAFCNDNGSNAACDGIACPANEHCIVECPACNGGSACICGPTCVGDGSGPGTCTGTVSCNMGPPECPAGTTAGISDGCWSGYCIPNADCTTGDPGSCDAQVLCNIAPPECPSGTVAGVVDNCWSGYCIPTADCGTAACDTITTEAACTARTDCEPVYSGMNCTCDESGCTCQSETFAGCETLPNGD